MKKMCMKRCRILPSPYTVKNKVCGHILFYSPPLYSIIFLKIFFFLFPLLVFSSFLVCVLLLLAHLSSNDI